MVFHIFRTFLYVLLWLSAAVLLGLTAARIHYTTHLPVGDPLNSGRNFYDPVVAELLVTSVFTLLWIPYILRTIHHRHQYSIFHTFLHSLIGLLALSILYIAGAATAASYWSSLSWCWKYHACRLLTVLHAFAWVCAVLAFILLLLEFIYAVRTRAWRRPMHGHYEEERRKGWFRG